MVNYRSMLLLCLFHYANSETASGRKLLMLSFDGFRNMYHDTYYLPWFRYIREQGAWASNISSVFPSDTFPNHWAIITGQHPESHGIVGSRFFDPKYNENFSKAKLEPKWWNQTVPLWKTALDAGISSASYFWVGSEVPEVTGLNKPFYHSYSEAAKTPFAQRLDGVLNYFKEGVDFVTMYYEEPDSTMHKIGPDAAAMEPQLRSVDDYLGMLIMKVHETGLKDTLDIIVCSDHGASTLRSSKSVLLSDYIDTSLITAVDEGAMAAFHAINADDTEEIIRNLTNIEHIKVYRKQDVPAHLHYGNSDRIEEIIVLADLEWAAQIDMPSKNGGGHGYDIYYREMKPQLHAIGPSFKKGFELKGFAQTKDIYSLAAKLLRVTPHAGNATDVLHQMLTSGAPSVTPSFLVLLTKFLYTILFF